MIGVVDVVGIADVEVSVVDVVGVADVEVGVVISHLGEQQPLDLIMCHHRHRRFLNFTLE
jgi:hypothetical protein